MRRFGRLPHALASLLAAVLLGLHVAPAAAQPSDRVVITGEVKTPLSLTATDLAAAPAQHQAEFTQTRGQPGAETRTTVRGVRLAAVIERAGLLDGARNDWKTAVVIATATDGYRAVFTWPELSNTGVGEGVLLLYQRDGQPLDAREGSIALQSTADKRLGARHVRNVARIEVRQLRD